MTRIAYRLLQVLLFAFMLVRPVQAVEPAPAPADGFRIGAGDVLLVTVWKQPALSLQLPVGPDGTLNYPLAGHIKAAGRTLPELEAALAGGLASQLRDAVVTVSLVQVHSFRIYILGEVLRPGEFELKGPLSLVQALALANGFTPFAKRERIVLVRRSADGSETRQSFDYAAYLAGGQPDPMLQPGDTLIVQ